MFTSGEEIDCPHLAGRPDGDRAAACVPVSVGGRSIGVLHATVSPDAPVTPLEVSRLESLATQAGARLGMLRVMEATHLQAATDPLTGLLNRRASFGVAHSHDGDTLEDICRAATRPCSAPSGRAATG
ncbi:MAG TPA: GAF domain-containing protein [Actinomycetes bacterium]